jgi:Domain of unknown function (DUF222)/HNH endonuclease
MQGTRTLRPAPEVLAEIAALLDGVDPCSEMVADAARLDLVASARRLAGRLQALASTVAAAVGESQAAERQVGVPLASWLAASQRMTRREAHRLIGVGQDSAPFPDLNRAALAGAVGIEQASAIATVLTRLPDDFSPAQIAEAEATMLGYASEFDSSGLARLSRRLVEVLDPVGADERDARRLERDLKQAKAARHLSFLPDGHGSVLIRGSLPILDAEPLVKLVDAYAQADRRAALDRLDPLAERVTPAMRRADGLCALVAAHQQRSLGPSCGGDRPRVVVTLDFDRLRARCVAAGLLGSGESITAGELRRLACDAEILPVVLGGASEILDVGRGQRLATPAIRLALDLRDGGCVFPGCDKPPNACHMHHLIPWWQGGSTSLGNLALLCPHHHGLVEPARDGPPGGSGRTRRRWEVRLGRDGVPEIIPPDHVDPDAVPRRHQRFRLTRRERQQ